MQCITCVHLVRPNICHLTGEIIKPMNIHNCPEWKFAPMDMMRLRLTPAMKFDDKRIVRLT